MTYEIFQAIECLQNLLEYDGSRDAHFKFSKWRQRFSIKTIIIYKNHCNKSTRRYSFSQRIIDNWNKLPSEIVNAPNLLLFKTQLDNF